MFLSSKKYRTSFYWIFIIAIILVLEAIFFRTVLWNDTLIGDDGDARLNILIMEHIWQFLHGIKDFADLGMFYPYQNTISYSDMNVGFTVPYSLCRFFGINIWLSGKIALILTHLFGTLTLFFFLLKKIRLSTICSLLGVILFSFSNAYSVKLGHTQLIAISLVPALLWGITNFFENIQNEDKRFRFACFSIIWYALICYTSFYTAFFTALFAGLVCLAYLILKPTDIKALIHFIQYNILECLAYLGLTVFIMAPFISIYIPTAQTFGPRPYDVVQFMLPTFADFINLSPDNLLYGKIINQIIPSSRPYGGELQVGFPFLTLILIFLSCFYFLFIYFLNRQREFPLKAAWSLAILFSFILLFKTASGYSLWYFIWAYVPGADSIRAISRYLMFLTLPCSILLAILFQSLSSQIASQKYKSYILILLCFFLWAENLHKRNDRWYTHERESFIENIPQPPSSCEAFYLIDTKGRKAPYKYQLDAWEIATHFKLKTINGYSGQFPKDWSSFGLFRLNEEKYLIGMEKYLKKYNLENVCTYDLGRNTWSEKPIISIKQLQNKKE